MKLPQLLLVAALLALSTMTSSFVFAQTRITIEAEKVSGKPIAVLPFISSTTIPQPINEIIENDLRASGKFAPIASRKFLTTPKNIDDIQYKDWRLVNADIVIVGEVAEIPPGIFDIKYRIYDIAQQKVLGNGAYQANADQIRDLAHLISDEVYENIIGIKGAYRTKIAYVKRIGRTSELHVADWDGYNSNAVVTSSLPIISPTWSPDGQKLAFVSFDGGSSVVRTVDLNTGIVSTLVRSPRGFNSAPAFSPDGGKLAYSSSRSGNPEIYVFDLESRRNTKVTNHWGIDTEPSWMRDNETIVFTSNRSGRANIYQANTNGGKPKRVTFDGKESAGASVSPDGKSLAFVKDGGSINIMQLKSRSLKRLSARKYDESPTFSPNGEMVMYATQKGGQGQLMVSSKDGRSRISLNYLSDDVREPSWSPYTSE